MRIDWINLTAFGHFSDQQLDLSGGRYGFHLVYGPNEAGKSTTLSAITDLLYGFPHVTSFGFKHQNRDLRIGGKITTADGRSIECIRRKGRTGTLYDIKDENPLDEESLRGLLRGVDRDAFLDRFGITHQALVEGGQMIVQGGGDVGQSLFAAGAGLGHLKQIQDAIASQCGALFKPTGSASTLNKLLSALKAKRTELRESVLPVKEFKRLEDDFAAREEEARNYRGAITELRRELKYLEALQTAIPLQCEDRQLAEQLLPLTKIPLLPEDFSKRQFEACSALHAIDEKIALISKQIDKSELALAELEDSTDLLVYVESIESLIQSLGGISKAQQQRPGLIGRRDDTRAEIAARLRSIDRDGDEDASNLHLPQEFRVQIRKLVAENASLVDRSARADEELAALRRQASEITDAISGSGQVCEPVALEKAINRAGDASVMVRDDELALASLERERRAVDNMLRRLTGLDCDADTAIQMIVPGTATVQKFAESWDAITLRHQKVDSERHELQASIEGHRTRLEEFQASGAVPTEGELVALRQRRDSLGELARERGPALDEFIELVTECDAIGDRLRREARSVAERARLEAEIASAARGLEKLDEELARLRSEQDDFSARWTELWDDCPVQPATPREMIPWLAHHERLIDLYEVREEAVRAVQRSRERIDTVSQMLAEAIAGAGHQPSSDDVVDLVHQATTVFQAARQQWQQHEDCLAEQKRVAKALPLAEDAGESAGKSLAHWRREWRSVTQRLQMRDDADTHAVDDVVEVYQDLTMKQQQCDALQHRIDGIDRDARDFADCVHSLGLPIRDAQADAAQIVRGWAEELKQAQKIRTQREQIEEQLTADRQQLAALEQQRAESRSQLSQLCREARCENAEQLPEVFAKSGQRQKIEQRRQELASRFAQLAVGTTIEEFMVAARSAELAELETRIEDLQHRLVRLDEDHASAREALGELSQQRKQMDGGARAAELQQEIQGLLGEIESQAETFARLRTAEAVLKQAIVSYREQHQGPVLGIASEYFRRLTLGAYSELRADNNDKGEPVLLAVRAASGQSVDLAGMSQGTADQLYLALRLASLKHGLSKDEPIPLVVDDILIQCDIDRSRAAMQLLAELSDLTQVIFFTHNAALLEVATDSIDPDRLFVAHLSEIEYRVDPTHHAPVKPKKRRTSKLPDPKKRQEIGVSPRELAPGKMLFE